MSYQAAVERMYALGHELAHGSVRKFDLGHMRVLLDALHNPERKFPSVLIAGTNGKGSTAATLASILQASGVRAGLYTSPHLVRINERIQIDRTQISDVDFALLHDVVDRTAERLVEEHELPWHPSFFEMLTAIAFEYFAQHKVELAVLEVGMGGRLDATNVVEPLLSVITDISLDHQKFLGNTVAEIAAEKAGIIHQHGTLVTLPQQPEANRVIGEVALKMNARGVSAVPYMPPVSPASPGLMSPHDVICRYPLEVTDQQITVETALLGRHQLRNIALAIATANELATLRFPVTPATIERGIRETRWPGRFQIIPASEKSPEYVLDVAHNPAGAWALRSALSARYDEKPFTLIFGAMRDKAIAEMAEILFPLARHVIITRAENPRSASFEEIRAAACRIPVELLESANVNTAIEAAKSLSGAEQAVAITGSIYVVGEAMQFLGLKP